jgi:hypothetical protein
MTKPENSPTTPSQDTSGSEEALSVGMPSTPTEGVLSDQSQPIHVEATVTAAEPARASKPGRIARLLELMGQSSGGVGGGVGTPTAQ